MTRGRQPITILEVRSVLLATIQVELRDAIADAFQNDVLAAIGESQTRGLIIDISAMEIVDSYVARIIATTGQMAALMGATTVLVGMRPEVAATLVRMGFRIEGVHTALDVDEGLDLLEELASTGAEARS